MCLMALGAVSLTSLSQKLCVCLTALLGVDVSLLEIEVSLLGPTFAVAHLQHIYAYDMGQAAFEADNCARVSYASVQQKVSRNSCR